ncbi:MAG: CFI-box-CTERM domain-containing protein [Candidatus Limivivens sp.]|nr:CFI-box-CTERM domain-containing protein [Candidatus Limivivens sp.]
MSFYTVAIEGLPQMLFDIENPLGNFKRNLYADQFTKYCERHLVTLEALENGYQTVVDKDQYLTNMAQAVADAAKEKIEAIPKKSQKEQILMDFNFCLAAYVYPCILEFGRESSEPLKDKMLAAWKEAFPKTNVQAANFETINQGFKRKFCYITTAVCETFGKPDDCYELNLFREYRDTYLAGREDGEAIIEEYYDLAPTIVKHIDRQQNKKEIYQNIWDVYLEPCMRMIEEARNEECMDLYIRMVRDLEKEYFFLS